MNWIFDGIKSIITGGNNVVKTLVGSKQERDKQSHDEFTQVQNSYQSEYTNTGGFFNSLVDGINRLVRPIYTFGTISLFIWAVRDAEGFKTAMAALNSVPEELWMIMGTITFFWFGSKSIFKDRHKYNYKYTAPKVVNTHTVEVVDSDDTPTVQKNVDLSTVDNKVIKDWLRST